MAGEKKNKSWIWTTIAIIVLLSGFFIWRKSWKLSHENTYYAYYSDVKGLQASSHINLKGVNVGKISDITIVDGKIKVTLTLKKETKLSDGTVALLASGGLLSDMSIKLVEGTGRDIIPNGATIPTAFDTSVMPTSIQITPYIETFKSMMGFADSSLVTIDKLIRTGLLTSFSNTVISVEEQSQYYANMVKNVNKKTNDIISTVNDADTSIAALAAKNNDITQTIAETKAKTEELAQSPMKERFASIHSSVTALNANIRKLNSKDSGLGNLIDNRKTYDNTTHNLEKTKEGLQETYEHPKGFSIFGGKKKKK